MRPFPQSKLCPSNASRSHAGKSRANRLTSQFIHDTISVAMKTYELYHGTDGDSILSILQDASMKPNGEHKIFFSERFDDALQHGGDLKRKLTFAFKAQVVVPATATLERTVKPGNPLTVIVNSVAPLATTILELYVRTPHQQQLQIVKGIPAIKTFLTR